MHTETFQKASITLEAAQRMLAAAAEKAEALGKGFVIALVDESGVLKAFVRLDGAPLLSVQVAQDKAYTAAGSGIATGDWFELIHDDPPLALGAPCGIDRLIVFGGGFPIFTADRQLVGGIGVSGGHYEEDVEVAQAALSVLSQGV